MRAGHRGPGGHPLGPSGAWRSCGARQGLHCLLLSWVRGGFRSCWPCLSPKTVAQRLFFVPSSVEATAPSLIVKASQSTVSVARRPGRLQLARRARLPPPPNWKRCNSRAAWDTPLRPECGTSARVRSDRLEHPTTVFTLSCLMCSLSPPPRPRSSPLQHRPPR